MHLTFFTASQCHHRDAVNRQHIVLPCGGACQTDECEQTHLGFRQGHSSGYQSFSCHIVTRVWVDPCEEFPGMHPHTYAHATCLKFDNFNAVSLQKSCMKLKCLWSQFAVAMNLWFLTVKTCRALSGNASGSLRRGFPKGLVGQFFGSPLPHENQCMLLDNLTHFC